jgi:O-antigen/teichoic acid export membrane protein
MSLLVNIGRLFILRGGGQLLSLLVVMYFTRELSPAILGEYFYFESLRSGMGLIAAFGIGGATEKFISEGNTPDEWYSTGLFMTIVLVCLGSVLFLLINTVIDQLLADKYLPYFLIALVTSQFVTYYRHVFRAELRAAVGGSINLIRVITFVISGIVAVHLGYGALGIIVAAILSKLVIVPISLGWTERTFTRPNSDQAKQLVNFAKYYILTVVGSKVFYFADVILIGLLLTKADVGIYEVTWRLILAAIVLNGIIANTAFSYISKSSSSENMEKVSEDIQTSMKYVLVLPFATVAGAFAVGVDAMTLLFTTDYVVEPYLLTVLAVGFVFQALYFLFSRSLVAINEPRISFYATAVAIVANLSLNLLFIPQFGMMGAAFATTTSFIIAMIAYYYLLGLFVNITLPARRFLLQFCAASLMGLIVYTAKIRLEPSSAPGTIGLVILGVITYFGILLTLRQTRNDLFSLFQGSFS